MDTRFLGSGWSVVCIDEYGPLIILQGGGGMIRMDTTLSVVGEKSPLGSVGEHNGENLVILSRLS